jgi:hypothetical protein
MQVGRHVPDLNHNRHAISMLACGAHVNSRKGGVCQVGWPSPDSNSERNVPVTAVVW